MNDHTVEPDPKTIVLDGGLLIGEHLAKCAYCGKWISGDENDSYHLTDNEMYLIHPEWDNQ